MSLKPKKVKRIKMKYKIVPPALGVKRVAAKAASKVAKSPRIKNWVNGVTQKAKIHENTRNAVGRSGTKRRGR